MGRIPPELLPEIAARHAAGQSDPAIVDWLAHRDPPVLVSRIAILKARRRATASPAATKQAAPKQAGGSGSGKLSGAAGAKIRAARTTQEAADHKKRGTVIIHVPPETRTERAHLHTLGVLLDLQVKVNADTLMGLPEKIRQTVMIAQAMAKIRMEAELERRIEQLEQERAVEAQVLVSERQAVEIERKRVEAERREIDEEWAKLRAERAR